MEKLLSPFKQSKLLNTLFLSTFFLSFYTYLVYFINSSFLSTAFSQTQVSALFIIGSIAEAIILVNIANIINKIGLYKTTIYLLIMEFIATLGLAVANTPFLMGMFFLVYFITISIISFNFDIFVESVSLDETKTGGIRATYLTISNIVAVIAPTMIAIILAHNSYGSVYFLSVFFLIPLYFYIRKFKKAEQKKLPSIRFKETILQYVGDKNLYNVFSSQMLLQLFYAFMSIYTPLYLLHMGFSWSEIGIIFTIMLLPFVFIELPVGQLADEKYGEKEFLTIGFVIMGISTLCISFITEKNFFMWAAILFITRIGASLVEITTDSYFFKHVNQEKTDFISFYRLTRPFSFIAAPLLATICLQFIPFEYTFLVLGAIMVYGAHYSLALIDTK